MTETKLTVRVCTDVSAAMAQTAGIGRYVRELTQAFAQLPQGPELRLLCNQQRHEELPGSLARLPRSTAPLSNKAWRISAGGGLPVLNRWGVTGGARMMVPPDDAESLAAAMLDGLAQSELRDALRQRGLAHVRHFTCERTAATTQEVYRDVYDAHHR